MLRSAALAAGLTTALVLAACHQEGHEAYVTIGADAVAAGIVAQLHGTVIEQAHDVALVQIDEAQLQTLAEDMHEQFGRCGGFELHDSLVTAEAELHAGAPPLTKIDYSLDRPQLVDALLPQLGADRIHATIGELSAMKNRYYLSESGAAASTWLAARWRSFVPAERKDVTIDLVDQGWPQKTVVMTIPGTTRASEIVVIGGHLDSIAVGGVNSTAPGADDDASGIATLSEVARALLASDARPERTIQFIGYAAEEIGLRGSQKLVADYKARGVNVVGALQLDMTNYKGSDKDIWLMKDFTSAPQNEFVGHLIDAYVGATWGWDACGYGCSDHASWYRAGVPASMPFESRMKQRNMRIHTGKDTLESSGDNAEHALKFARLGLAYAIELSKADAPGAAAE